MTQTNDYCGSKQSSEFKINSVGLIKKKKKKKASCTMRLEQDPWWWFYPPAIFFIELISYVKKDVIISKYCLSTVSVK